MEKIEFTPEEMRELGEMLFDRDFYPDYMFLLQMADWINNMINKKRE